MSEIPLREVPDEVESDGTPILRRWMTPEEIKEREELNVLITSARLRQWVPEWVPPEIC